MSLSLKDLKIFNSISGKKETFVSINKKNVGMYVCGPTVYNSVHLGNCRTFISFDVIYRYLIHLGFKVRYVRNITDVGHLENDDDNGEDKISKKARLEKLEPMEVVKKYTTNFHYIMNKFNTKPPSIEPTATGHIIEQIDCIEKILKSGFAYIKNGSVYFDVKKFDKKNNYGKLSGRVIDEMLNNSRSLDGSNDKKNPQDFALWKKADKSHIMKWISPWGSGFPGWHLECTAMSKKYLGDVFDIHGGGLDLKFPHHDCEIAQSESINKKNPARYWLHTNMLTLNGKKMSKSLNNFILPEEIFNGNNKFFEKPYDPNVVKFFMFQAHYRNILDLSNEALKAAEKGFNRLVSSIELIAHLSCDDKKSDFHVSKWRKACYEAMNDDFNTPVLISTLFECSKFINSVKVGNKNLNKDDKIVIENVFNTFFYDVLGFGKGIQFKNSKEDDLVKILIDLRNEARLNRNFNLSDDIRNKLLEIGIKLNDNKNDSSYNYID